MTQRSESYHAAMASAPRRAVLDALLASSDPLDAAAVAERLGLHITTARFHLDQLVEAGLVRRHSSAEARRGRPRLLYALAGPPRERDAREQLIRVLADALAGHSEAEALDAGRHWAAAFDPLAPQNPVPGLVDALDRLGFDPEVEDANLIRLPSCPFRGAAREHPEVICTAHRGLVDQLLAGTSRAGDLRPFAEPELCLVTLRAAVLA